MTKRSEDQLSFLAPAPPPAFPDGFLLHADLISPAEEAALIRAFAPLPFKEFQFQGYEGKRRVVSFGWRYDFNDRQLHKADDMPDFLKPLRAQAASFANRDARSFQHVLITEYAPGAGIGWHRDRPVFEDVIGISLGAACTFRLRQKDGARWRRTSFQAAPRSAYLLSGAVRWDWEHSIPPVSDLRYSITFRNFKPEFVRGPHA